jgi:protein phosphatase PTC7
MKEVINIFNSGVHINPHYQKRDKGGEDAVCVNDRLLCVADGVGGWAESGVDPAIYSKKLCSIMDDLYKE